MTDLYALLILVALSSVPVAAWLSERRYRRVIAATFFVDGPHHAPPRAIARRFRRNRADLRRALRR